MSSFKRKSGSPPVQQVPIGARQSFSAPSVSLISSGIPSLDDVLGGGFPLGCVVALLTPDLHSAWGTLIQRYFIAQGLAGDQAVCVVRDNAKDLVDGCMWLAGTKDLPVEDSALDHIEQEPGAKIKIAWRYEKMKQFQTTVPATSSNDFCDTFDLTIRIPETAVSKSIESGQLFSIGFSEASSAFDSVLDRIREVVKEGGFRIDKENPAVTKNRQRALRLSIPDLGDPYWGDPTPTEILGFLYALRLIVRSTNVAVLVTLPPHLSSENPSFLSPSPPNAENWLQKIGFLTDGCLLFSSFGADPSLSALFKTYHGAVRVIRAPSPHTLLAPSHKHSVLRGLHASSLSSSTSTSSTHAHTSSMATGGTGENNLAFKCTRKRFIIETLHLDVEGGVGERRTSAPSGATRATPGAPEIEHSHHEDMRTTHGGPTELGPNSVRHLSSAHSGRPKQSSTLSRPPLEVAIDPASAISSLAPAITPDQIQNQKKEKKRVAFQSDRPDLYDF